MSSRQDASKGALFTSSTLERLEPLVSGLLIALLVTLTLGVAVAMGGSEQALVARVEPTPGPTTAAVLVVTPKASSPTPMPTSWPSPSPTPMVTLWPSPSPLPPSATTVPTEPPTPRPASRSAGCVPPSNWRLYTVRSGESLSALAWRYWTSDYSLLQANCLTSKTLRAGQRIYVPNVAPRQACGRPPGWVAYTVQRGNTLYGISVRLGITISVLKNANCLVGDTIYAGATLWVPRPLPAPTQRPAPTATRVPTKPGQSPSATPAGTDVTPTEPSPTDPLPTEPSPTDPSPTDPSPTDPPPTDPPPTDPPPTEPPPTDPPPTEPPPTEPPPTEPPPTEPPPTDPPPTDPPTEGG